mmetsp:Transcript_17491/g.56747  ORF Transcript_17491/g.56747 Transcript_17491/m.56747 type:complete len:209 (+) Transcript_17491:550-1176(+)
MRRFPSTKDVRGGSKDFLLCKPRVPTTRTSPSSLEAPQASVNRSAHQSPGCRASRSPRRSTMVCVARRIASGARDSPSSPSTRHPSAQYSSSSIIAPAFSTLPPPTYRSVPVATPSRKGTSLDAAYPGVFPVSKGNASQSRNAHSSPASTIATVTPVVSRARGTNAHPAGPHDDVVEGRHSRLEGRKKTTALDRETEDQRNTRRRETT